jgi:hypothetical protein
MNPDLEILKAALNSAGDADALARVRTRADAIRDAFDDDDIDLTAEQLAYLDQHRDWVGEVYAAVGGDVEAGEDSAMARAIQEVRADEAAEIGEAFMGLMELLAESGYDWKHRLASLRYPEEDSAAWASLLSEPSVIAAKGHGYQLFSHTGLTPSNIYEATRGLHLLFERMVDSLEESPQGRSLNRKPDSDTMFFVLAGETGVPISHDLVRAEIAGTPDLVEDAVEPLCNWIMDVLAIQPLLIEGYFYSAERRAFTPLAQLDLDIPDDLIAQWSHSERRTRERRLAARVTHALPRRALW